MKVIERLFSVDGGGRFTEFQLYERLEDDGTFYCNLSITPCENGRTLRIPIPREHVARVKIDLKLKEDSTMVTEL